jgi:endonuclease-3
MKLQHKAARIREILDRLVPDAPVPLQHRDPYTLLVAVLLSAQCTDERVNKTTPRLFARASTPQQMQAVPVAEIRELIKPCGLSPQKAKAIAGLSRMLVEQHGGEVPRERTALEALPGVGRKTANVVLNTAFGADTIAVDTHIFRVANRMRLAPGKTPLAVERALNRLVPAPYRRHAHHWLILHGRYTCQARRPRCGTCLVFDLCEWRDKHRYACEPV